MDSKKTKKEDKQHDESPINDPRPAEKHGDYRQGDSDSEYPEQINEKSVHQEGEKQGEEGDFLESEDDIADYRGKGREEIDRNPSSGIDYR